MPGSKLSAAQLFAILSYVLFFAVQLHFRYADIRFAGSEKFSPVVETSPGQQHPEITKRSSSDLQGRFNVRLNKRFFPSDHFLLPSVTAESDVIAVCVRTIKHYCESTKLLTQIGPAGSDRGPPSLNI